MPPARRLVVAGVEIREDDDVLVAGRANGYPDGFEVRRLRGVVATVDVDDECFKLWPDRGEHGGKVWFRAAAVAAIEVAARGCCWPPPA